MRSLDEVSPTKKYQDQRLSVVREMSPYKNDGMVQTTQHTRDQATPVMVATPRTIVQPNEDMVTSYRNQKKVDKILGSDLESLALSSNLCHQPNLEYYTLPRQSIHEN